MTALILIKRTMAGDAFEYHRYSNPPLNHTNQLTLDPVPVGNSLPVLSPQDVELYRSDPERFFRSVG